jgi:hypothetical protein
MARKSPKQKHQRFEIKLHLQLEKKFRPKSQKKHFIKIFHEMENLPPKKFRLQLHKRFEFDSKLLRASLGKRR